MRKKIIFGGPDTFFLTDSIVKNLEYCGFDVVNITFDQRYKYKNLRDRIINLFYKIFFKYPLHKKKLKFLLVKEKIEQKLSLIQKADYVLIVRPDIYPKEFLNYLKTKTNKMVAYQWDGMNRFPEVWDYIHFFDDFYVFDKADVSEQLKETTNFYFDNDLDIHSTKCEEINQVYFVGSYLKKRVKNLDGIVNAIKETGVSLKILIHNPTKKEITNRNIESIAYSINYEENIELSKSSKYLLDLHNYAHNGLSFRVFDSIKYQKKLITNNHNIKNYDFYNENNIFVWNDHNLHLLKEFVAKPYIDYPPEIYKKYSFTSWINTLLDSDDFVETGA